MGMFSLLKKSSILYYPGCATYYQAKANFEFYKEILALLDIIVRVKEGDMCCGLPALEAGYETEGRKIAKKNLAVFKENNITQIITNCPCCYKMFLKDYLKSLLELKVKSLRNL